MTLRKKVFHQNLTETSSEHKWTLHNFSACNDQIVNSQIISNVAGYKNDLKWKLILHPDGESEDSKGYVSMFLHSYNHFKVMLDWEITVASNFKIYSNRRKYRCTFRGYNEGWGTKRYLERSSLLNDLKKGDDVLKITLKIFFSKEPANPQHNLIAGLESLLKSKENADVTLISEDGKEHKAHKIVLMFRSKVFSAMFQHNMKESKENKVKIEDVDNETLRAMLCFIYTGKIENIRENTKKLLIVADKYELNDLKEMCADHLCENITVKNVLDLIEFSQTYSICELEKRAKDYFLKNHKQVMSVKGLKTIKQLSRNTVNHLLYELGIHENEVSSSV